MLAISVTQTANKEWSFVFCMKCQPRAIVRLARFTIRGQKVSPRSIQWALQRRTFLSRVSGHSEDPAMGKEKVQFQLKTPKGTKDCRYHLGFGIEIDTKSRLSGEGKNMVIRDRIFSTITDVFKRHGAVTIDT